MRMRRTIGLSLALLVASTAAMAKQVHPGRDHAAPSTKSKIAEAVTAAAKAPGKRHHAHTKLVAHSRRRHTGHVHRHAGHVHRHTSNVHRHTGQAHRHAGLVHRHTAQAHRHAGLVHRHAARLPPPDKYIGPLQAIGRREIGDAAWYGGRHLGRRTASGERLDAIHLTAAHRSLPLYSLVRVTNLTNGRSVVARINDRGPVSHSLLIDVSPGVADRLDMKRAGIVKVAIELVAPAPSPPR